MTRRGSIRRQATPERAPPAPASDRHRGAQRRAISIAAGADPSAGSRSRRTPRPARSQRRSVITLGARHRRATPGRCAGTRCRHPNAARRSGCGENSDRDPERRAASRIDSDAADGGVVPPSVLEGTDKSIYRQALTAFCCGLRQHQAATTALTWRRASTITMSHRRDTRAANHAPSPVRRRPHRRSFATASARRVVRRARGGEARIASIAARRAATMWRRSPPPMSIVIEPDAAAQFYRDARGICLRFQSNKLTLRIPCSTGEGCRSRHDG
jgi:hypothetical protein